MIAFPARQLAKKDSRRWALACEAAPAANLTVTLARMQFPAERDSGPGRYYPSPINSMPRRTVMVHGQGHGPGTDDPRL